MSLGTKFLFFIASGSNQWTPLMEDVTENLVFVPLKQGTSNEILVVGEDNVGNRDDSGTNIEMIYLPHLIRMKQLNFLFQFTNFSF